MIMTRFGSALALAALIALTACGQSGGNTRGKPRSESNSAGSMMILHHGNAAEPGTLDPDLALLENEISIIGDTGWEYHILLLFLYPSQSGLFSNEYLFSTISTNHLTHAVDNLSI